MHGTTLPGETGPDPEAARKRDLRRDLLGERTTKAPPAGSPAAREAGAAAAEALFADPDLSDRLGRARHVALYLAIGHEFDPAPLGEALRRRGAALYYPRVGGAGAPLSFHVLPDPQAARRSAFGVLEPAPDQPEAADLDAFLVPGLGFDRDGHRLGYGQGHYDRTLRRWPRALRIAPCYSFQVRPHIPHGEHDEPVDVLLTPLGVHRTQARPVPARDKEE